MFTKLIRYSLYEKCTKPQGTPGKLKEKQGFNLKWIFAEKFRFWSGKRLFSGENRKAGTGI